MIDRGQDALGTGHHRGVDHVTVHGHMAESPDEAAATIERAQAISSSVGGEALMHRGNPRRVDTQLTRQAEPGGMTHVVGQDLRLAQCRRDSVDRRGLACGGARRHQRGPREQQRLTIIRVDAELN